MLYNHVGSWSLGPFSVTQGGTRPGFLVGCYMDVCHLNSGGGGTGLPWLAVVLTEWASPHKVMRVDANKAGAPTCQPVSSLSPYLFPKTLRSFEAQMQASAHACCSINICRNNLGSDESEHQTMDLDLVLGFLELTMAQPCSVWPTNTSTYQRAQFLLSKCSENKIAKLLQVSLRKLWGPNDIKI